MTSQLPTLTPRTIGETENALRAILNQSLAGTGLDYHRWVALKLVSESDPPATVKSAVDVMTGGLKIDETAATKILDDLSVAGILTRSDDQLITTPEGEALYERVTGRTSQNAQTMWEGLMAEDLATAQRVLTTIRDRANVILAGN